MPFGGRLRALGSGQVIPYHPQGPAYRCSLPGLAGFTGVRRRGLGRRRLRTRPASASGPLGRPIGPTYSGFWVQGTANPPPCTGLAEGVGFEPTAPFWGAHALQACLFVRSSTPPIQYAREDSNLRPAA